MQDISRVFNALGITTAQFEKALLTEVDRFSPDNGVVKDLLYCTSDIKVGQACLDKALFVAVEHDKSDIAWLLLEHGANIEARNDYGDTPLLAACRKSSFETARMLVHRDAEVNVRDIQGQTPLMAAARFGSPSLAQDLIEKGAILDIPSSSGATALTIAEQHGHSKIAALLKPQATVEKEPASTQYPDEGVHALLDITQGDKPETLGRALLASATCGKSVAVEVLLDHGANIETFNGRNETALLIASRENFVEGATLLVARGADVNVKDKYGRTPLMWAAHWGNASLVKDMIEKGARVDVISDSGETAYSTAVRQHAGIGVIALLSPTPQQPEAAPKKQKSHKRKHHGRQYG